MKWTNDRADNVDYRRGSGGGGMLVGGGLGIISSYSAVKKYLKD